MQDKCLFLHEALAITEDHDQDLIPAYLDSRLRPPTTNSYLVVGAGPVAYDQRLGTRPIGDGGRISCLVPVGEAFRVAWNLRVATSK
jgi:hypothetical protein